MHAGALGPLDENGAPHETPPQLTAFSLDGWETWLELSTENDQTSAPAADVICQRCEDGEKTAEAARAGQGPIMPPILQSALVTKDTPVPPSHDRVCALPTFKQGPRLREMFAGKGPLSASCVRSGIPIDEPVEYFMDPDHRFCFLPNHDCTDPQVRSSLEANFSAPPDAKVANIVWFSNDCRTHSDYNCVNHGTRTFDQPDGDGTREDERQANTLNDWTAHCIELLHQHDRLSFLEQQNWTGRYPKIWDRPRMQLAIKRTKAVILPLAMCEFGKTSVADDGTDVLVRKQSWVLVLEILLPWILSIWRPCSALKTSIN